MSVTHAVVLAAGLGARLGDSGKRTPKGFLDIDGVVLIERSLDLLSRAGIRTVWIGTGHCAEAYQSIRRSDMEVKCVHNPNFASSGSLETLCEVGSKLTEDFVLLESDILYEKRGLDEVLKSPGENVLLASGFTGSGDEVFVTVDSDRRLTGLTKDSSARPSAYGELVGITKLSIRTLRRILSGFSADRPTRRHYEDALTAVGSGVPISVLRIGDLAWGEVDTEEHRERLIRFVLPRIRETEHAA